MHLADAFSQNNLHFQEHIYILIISDQNVKTFNVSSSQNTSQDSDCREV